MENLIFNRIGEVLKRDDINMTCTDLAKKMGRSRQHISKWVTNTGQPTIKGLFNIARVLGVPASELLAEKNPIKKLIKKKPRNNKN